MIGLWCGISAILAIGWMGTTWVLVVKLEEEKEINKDCNHLYVATLEENWKLKKELAAYKEKESKSLKNKIKAVLHRGKNKGE